CLIELTFQVATRMRKSDREARAAAARGRGVGIVDAERGADQVVDEIDFRARQKRHRRWIDQHHRMIALDHQIVLGLRALDVELVLEAGAAAALDRDAQHGAIALVLEDLADPACGPFADGDGSAHFGHLAFDTCHTHFIWYAKLTIVKYTSD